MRRVRFTLTVDRVHPLTTHTPIDTTRPEHTHTFTNIFLSGNWKFYNWLNFLIKVKTNCGNRAWVRVYLCVSHCVVGVGAMRAMCLKWLCTLSLFVRTCIWINLALFNDVESSSGTHTDSRMAGLREHGAHASCTHKLVGKFTLEKLFKMGKLWLLEANAVM